MTLPDLSALIGLSEKDIRVRLRKHSVPVHNGEVDTALLPGPWQRRLREAENRPAVDPVNDRWTLYTEGQRRSALKKLDLVNRAKAELGASRNRTRLLEQIAAEGGVSGRTLQRLIKLHDEGRIDERTGELIAGVMALAGDYGKTAKKSIIMDQQTEDIIKQEWLRPQRPSKSTVYQAVITFCNHNRKAVPSYATVCRYIDNLPRAVTILHRYGKDAYRQKFEAVVNRTVEDLKPNEIWVGDHREHDVFIYVNKEHKVIKRVWMTAWWDWGSGKLVGWCFSFRPNSRTIALALRNAILTHGLPQKVYIDNGKDYQSHTLHGITKIGKIPLDTETHGLLLSLGIHTITALPYNARAKGIERWFLLWAENFDNEMPGWAGRNAKEKPEKLSAEIKTGQLLDLVKFKLMAEHYRAKLDAKPYGSRGKSPAEFYQNLHTRTVSENVLDVLLLQKKQNIKLTPRGIEAFPGVLYRSEHLMAHVLVGSKITVRYDPDDLSKILVWRDDGKFIGAVPVEQRVSQAGGLNVQAIKQVQRYRRQQKELLDNVSPGLSHLHKPGFADMLARVRKIRHEERDSDLGKPVDRAEGRVVHLFGQKLERLADELENADLSVEPEVEKVKPLFGKAIGDAVTEPEEKPAGIFKKRTLIE